jgi:hypothetical protein
MPVNSGKERRGLFRLRVLGLIALLLLLLQFLFGTLPKAALYFVADNMAATVLNETKPPAILPISASKRLFALWMEQNIISQMYSAHPSTAQDDATRIGMRLVTLRSALLSQLELHHDVPEAPVEIAGIGWCEGLNGVAAILLSHEFDNAELVTLKGPSQVAGDGHSFGRVWSLQYNDWLYFDIWSGEVAVFRNKRGQRAQYLFRQIPKGLIPQASLDMEKLHWFHDRAKLAVTQNQLQPTLGGYLGNRIANYFDHGFTAPESAAALIAIPVSVKAPSEKQIKRFENTTSASQSYVHARLAQLLGNTNVARQYYQKVANMDVNQNSTYVNAAAMFVQRLDAANAVR